MSDKLITLDNLSYYNSKVKEVISNQSQTVQDDVDLHKNDTNNPHSVTKSQVGLSNVDNTSDIDKPISTATQSALDTITNQLASHIDDTSNPHNVTKQQVGLDQVNNTSDTDKPVSTAQALAIKIVQDDLTEHKNAKNNPHEVTKAQVGLGNVDNTSDIDKPVSTATQTAINGVTSLLDEHTSNKANPHNVTKEQLNLGNVDNTSDKNKPISDATQTALNNITSVSNSHISNKTNPHSVTKSQVGLGNVTNDAQVKRTEIGEANGVASLDENGRVPSSQLPSFVDDVKDVYATYTKSGTGVLTNITLYSDSAKTQKVIGESGKIYQNITEGEPSYQFRWTGTVFAQSGASTLIIGEVTGTAYDGAKGKANANNIAKIKQTELTHIKHTNPITITTTKVSLNYECFTGDQYGTTGSSHAADFPAATTTAAGVMSSTDKTKLNGIEAGAQVNKVTSVAGKTGAVILSKSDVGLGNVNNTSDANKPISTATQTALDKKVDKVTGKGLSTNDYTTTEKNKLAGIAEGAQVNSITGVKGSLEQTYRTGNVSISASNIGLGNVNNTSDANKPVSTAQATAIADAKKAGTDAQIAVTAEVTRAKAAEEAIQTALNNHKANKDKKHIPAGGHERQILAWDEEGKAKWDDLANMFTGLEELLAYGVEWKDNVADPHLTRIGNMSLHKTLPIQSQLKGCIAQGDKVIYWLDEDNWKYKKGGNPNKGEPEQLARLDGYDGTVRIYCPSFYIKSKLVGNKRQVWLSTVKIDDTWTYQPEILVDAYRSTVLNAVPEHMGYLSTLTVNSAISVVNTNAYCRGGGNRSDTDQYLATDSSRSDLCKPRTYMSRAAMRTYSRNAGSEMLSYDQYKNIFYWLYVIEYANFNCQEAYNEAVTAEGYKQGGLGAGVTTINNTYWSYYNGNYPLTPCGYCNELGNGTGLKTMTVVTPTTSGGDPTQTYNFSVPRWRGFDNPFGDIWTNLDGIIIQGDAEGNPKTVYTTTDPNNYGDNESAKNAMEIAGHEIHQDGCTKEFDLGEAAHIIPESVGGDITKYKCDYHWTGSKDTSLRILLVGSCAHDDANAGLCDFGSGHGVSGAWTNVGFRSVSTFLSFSE